MTGILDCLITDELTLTNEMITKLGVINERGMFPEDVLDTIGCKLCFQ